MYTKQAYSSGIAPIGAAAKLFNPILDNAKLDMLGGVGEYTLPQRGVGMGLGALIGGYLGGEDHREAGSVLGAGLGYGGAMAADNGVRVTRRMAVEDGLQHGINTGTIITPTLEDAVNDFKKTVGPFLDAPVEKKLLNELIDSNAKAMVTPAFTLAGTDAHSGTIWNNYEYMHKLVNSKDGLQQLDSALADKGIPVGVRGTILEEAKAVSHMYAGMPDPSVARFPLLTHELLERKDMFYRDKKVPASIIGDYKGKALDAYGPGIGMNHGSIQVLGDEMNLAQRTMTPDEISFMRNLRNSSGEFPTISTTRNLKDMYTGLIPTDGIDAWAKTTGKAIHRGINTGELLSDAEQAIINSGLAKRLGTRAGAGIRDMEYAGASVISAGLQKLFDKSKKYLPKLL